MDAALRQPPGFQSPGTVTWDAAFQNESGSQPIHYTARYLDGRGQVHRLESWRIGQLHLRRKTDDRIDLHADAVSQQGKTMPSGQALDYLWQIIDVRKNIDHRVSTAGMMHLGMLYSYYSMAHVLSRPAGSFSVHKASEPDAAEQTSSALLTSRNSSAKMKRGACTWWQIDAPSQPSMRVCWMSRYGVPARTFIQTGQGWRLDFQVDEIGTNRFSPGVFAVNTAGMQVRDVDEIESED